MRCRFPSRVPSKFLRPWTHGIRIAGQQYSRRSPMPMIVSVPKEAVSGELARGACSRTRSEAHEGQLGRCRSVGGWRVGRILTRVEGRCTALRRGFRQSRHPPQGPASNDRRDRPHEGDSFLISFLQPTATPQQSKRSPRAESRLSPWSYCRASHVPSPWMPSAPLARCRLQGVLIAASRLA